MKPQLPISAALICLIALSACSSGAANPASNARTAAINKQTIAASVSATGNVAAESETRLGFQVTGSVADVKVKNGDLVKKGAVLALLDTTDLQISLQQAEAAVAQSEVAIAQGEISVANAAAALEQADINIINAGVAITTAGASVLQAEVAQRNAYNQAVIAQAGYSRTVEGARQADIDAAQAALNSATESLAKLQRGPTAEDTASARANLGNAEASLKQAQFAYDNAFRRDPAGIGASPAAVQLEQATNNFTNAKAQVDRVAKPADAAQLAAAQQQVESARAGVDRLKNQVKPYDIAQAEAQRRQAYEQGNSAVAQRQTALAQKEQAQNSVRLSEVARKVTDGQRKAAEAQVRQAGVQKQTAELQVKQAKRRIEQTALTAPGDGIIRDLNLRIGEQVSGAPVVTLVNTDPLHIDVTVDEIDIARVKLAQEVNVTLDALPGKSFKAKVDRVSPTSRLVNGVVSYDVRVLLPADADLRVGMTSSASITLDRRENVLAAPNWAVRRDRKAGKNFLTVREGDKNREVEVQVGLRNDQFTEILSGINEGTTVVAPEVPNALGT